MQLTCICIIYEERKNPQFATKTTKQLTKRKKNIPPQIYFLFEHPSSFFFIYFKHGPIKKIGVIFRIHTLVSLLLNISHKNHDKS